MRTNYRKLRKAANRFIEASNARERVASLRIGVLEGGPSIDAENAELATAMRDLVELTRAALANGARIRTVASVVENCYDASQEVSYAIIDRM